MGFFITISVCGLIALACTVGTIVEIIITKEPDSPKQKAPPRPQIPMNANQSSWTEFDKQPLLINEPLEPAAASIFLRILACFSLREAITKVYF